MQYSTAGVAFLTAAAVFAAVALVTWRRRANNPTVATALAFVMVGACWWSLADAGTALATNPTLASIAALLIFPGLGATVAGFACLGLAIARPAWVPTRRVVGALAIEPVLVSLAAVTNGWHFLVYRGPGAVALTDPAGWTYGPLFWVHTGYSYLALAVGMVLIAWSCVQAPPVFRVQRLTLFAASLAPVAVNVVFLSGGFKGISDPTPLGFAVTGTIMAFAIFRQDLLTLAPIARGLIIDQIGDVIVALNPLGRVLDLNPAASSLVRRVNPGAPATLVGAPGADLFGDALEITAPAGGFAIDVPGAGRIEIQVRESPLVDRRGRLLGTVFVGRDVSAAMAQTRRLTEANAQLISQVQTIDQLRADLVELAARDLLTGLHNRRYMVERFAGMLMTAELESASLAVALIDVDRFKAINDQFGHLVGDEVLVSLAGRISAHLPAGALVARWGGEEFFIAVPGASAAQGYAVAEEVRRRCERDDIAVAGAAVHCTVSVGVATYPESGDTMNELFHAADVSLYEAKKSGRNAVRPVLVPMQVGSAPYGA